MSKWPQRKQGGCFVCYNPYFQLEHALEVRRVFVSFASEEASKASSLAKCSGDVRAPLGSVF